MYEYEVLNKLTGEVFFMYGYDWLDALDRAHRVDQWKAGEITYIYREYID